jgi:DNA repair protein RadC
LWGKIARLSWSTINSRATLAQADIQMTMAIVNIAAPLGISVQDRIIVGKNGHANLKGLKLI